MAIQQFENKGALSSADIDGLIIALNNGDREALELVVREWGFHNAEAFMRFAIAVMLKARSNRRLFIEQEGEHVVVSPNESLLR